MQKSDILTILTMARPGISLAKYCLQLHCQPTPTFVERSFLMLQRFLLEIGISQLTEHYLLVRERERSNFLHLVLSLLTEVG